MIGVKKISHASYETPDLERQIAYYTDILGLSLIAKDKEASYLANTVEHHSVILRRGSDARCTRIGFQLGPDDDLDAFEKQTAAHGVRSARKKDPEPTIKDMVTFEDPKGSIIEVFKLPSPPRRKEAPRPEKKGHGDVRGPKGLDHRVVQAPGAAEAAVLQCLHCAAQT